MNLELHMQLALLLPLWGALLVTFTGKWPNLREACSLVVGGLLFATLCCAAMSVFNGNRPELTLLEVLPGIELGLHLEPLGMIFALVASGLWIITTLYAIGYMRGHHETHQTRFFACFALAIFATMGAAMARNLYTLFLFYELLTFSTYPLVTHHGTEKAKRGGRVYLGVLLTTSVLFFLLAVVITAHFAGTVEFVQGGILEGTASRGALMLLLALFAFGTGKAALMPFHRWLPAAMVAPTPVSALLHAVAVVKVGVFTVMKIAIYVFGVDLLAEQGLSTWLMFVAAATILIASLVAMTRDNLKERLAYSTISQLSYIVLGAALANELGILGGGMHIVMHAFGKITLFFCAGAIYVAAHKTQVSELDGLGRAMPWTFGAFALASISIIGLPPCGGAWSKWYLALGAAEAGYIMLVATFMISSLLNIAYLMPIPIRAFFLPAKEEPQHGEAPLFCVAPLCFTAIVSLLLFFSAEHIYAVLLPLTSL